MRGLSLIVESRDYPLVAVHGLLMHVTSLVAERGLSSAGSVVAGSVVAHRLSCFKACGIFLDQG